MMHNSRCLSILSVCLWVPLSLCTLVHESRADSDVVTYDGLVARWDAQLAAIYGDYPGFSTLDEIMWWCYDEKGFRDWEDYYLIGESLVYTVNAVRQMWGSIHELPRWIKWDDSLIVDTNSMIAPGCYSNFVFSAVVSPGPYDSVADIRVALQGAEKLPRWLDLLHQCTQIYRRWSFDIAMPVFGTADTLEFHTQDWVLRPPLYDGRFSWTCNLAPAGCLAVPNGLYFTPYPGYQGGMVPSMVITDPYQASYTCSVLQDCPIPRHYSVQACFVWPSDSDFTPVVRSIVNYDVTIRRKP